MLKLTTEIKEKIINSFDEAMSDYPDNLKDDDSILEFVSTLKKHPLIQSDKLSLVNIDFYSDYAFKQNNFWLAECLSTLKIMLELDPEMELQDFADLVVDEKYKRKN